MEGQGKKRAAHEIVGLDTMMNESEEYIIQKRTRAENGE
jgi:hypothetical protein